MAATARTRSENTNQDYSVHVFDPDYIHTNGGREGGGDRGKKKKKLSVYVCVTEHVRVLAAISHHRPD